MKSSFLDARQLRLHLRDAVILAGVAMVLSIPMLYHQFTQLMSSVFVVVPNTDQIHFLVLKQSVVVFALTFLCALLAFVYQQRLCLPHFGQWGEVRFWGPIGLVAGLFTTLIAYFIVDREVLEIAPEMYRRVWLMALAEMLGNAVVQEIIARLGFLSIILYFMQRLGCKYYPWPAALLVAVLSVIYTFLFWDRHGVVELLSTSQTILVLLGVFLTQWLYGEVYLRYGFVAAVCVHFGMTVKLLIYSFLV